MHFKKILTAMLFCSSSFAATDENNLEKKSHKAPLSALITPDLEYLGTINTFLQNKDFINLKLLNISIFNYFENNPEAIERELKTYHFVKKPFSFDFMTPKEKLDFCKNNIKIVLECIDVCLTRHKSGSDFADAFINFCQTVAKSTVGVPYEDLKDTSNHGALKTDKVLMDLIETNAKNPYSDVVDFFIRPLLGSSNALKSAKFDHLLSSLVTSSFLYFDRARTEKSKIKIDNCLDDTKKREAIINYYKTFLPHQTEGDLRWIDAFVECRLGNLEKFVSLKEEAIENGSEAAMIVEIQMHTKKEDKANLILKFMQDYGFVHFETINSILSDNYLSSAREQFIKERMQAGDFDAFEKGIYNDDFKQYLEKSDKFYAPAVQKEILNLMSSIHLKINKEVKNLEINSTLGTATETEKKTKLFDFSKKTVEDIKNLIKKRRVIGLSFSSNNLYSSAYPEILHDIAYVDWIKATIDETLKKDTK